MKKLAWSDRITDGLVGRIASISLLLLFSFLLLPLSVHAVQLDSAPWQVAQAVADLTFEAQRALLAAQRAAGAAGPSAQSEHEQAAHRQEAVLLLATGLDRYEQSLRPELVQTSPAAALWIDAAWADALAAARTGDSAALAAARGRLWTGLLWGAMSAADLALRQEDGPAAAEWLRLREFRRATRVSTVTDRARQTVEAYVAGQVDLETARSIVGDDLRDTYFFRLREALGEVEQAAAKNYVSRASEWAGQLRGYAALLRVDLAHKESAQTAARLDAILYALEVDAIAGKLDAIPGAVAAARDLLINYLPVALSEAEIARRSQLLYLFIDLVYSEYKDGVRNGEIVIDTEYQEAVTFRNQAEVFLSELTPLITEVDPAAAMRLSTLLLDMKSVLDALDDKQIVRSQVDEALSLLEATLGQQVADGNGDGVFITIATLLNEMEKQVARQEYKLAENTRIQAYALFDAGPELRLMAVSPSLVGRLDGLFWQGHNDQPGLAQVIAQQRPPDAVASVRADLDAGLADAQQVLSQGAAPLAIVTNSALIVFREGLEAVVILAALMASMVGAYVAYRRSMVYGILLALLATAVTWWGAQQLLLAFSGFGERLEAVVSLLAVGVLLLITNWFFHRVYWKDWLAGFHQRKKQILGGGGPSILTGQAVGFVLLGFSSVYREGFETVLFLQALVLEAGLLVVLEGVALGMLGVALVGFATFRLQNRLPYKRMLVITGILIGGVLLVLVGNTIHTMQAVGWLSITPAGSLSLPYWLGLWCGLFPTWETLGGQTMAAIFVVGSYYLAEYQQKQNRHTPAARSTSSRPVSQHPA